jgi:hypothetical protein
MRVNQISTAIAAAALNVGVMCSGSIASAADMPLKALPPPVASPFVLDVHGFFDLTVANTRVTGSGLYLYPRAAVVQPSLGLALDIYKDPNGLINSFSVFGGVWNESWTSPRLPVSGRHWQEMDWWIGASVGFAQHWKLAVQLLEFEILNTFNPVNYTATLSFDDSYLGSRSYSARTSMPSIPTTTALLSCSARETAPFVSMRASARASASQSRMASRSPSQHRFRWRLVRLISGIATMAPQTSAERRKIFPVL